MTSRSGETRTDALIFFVLDKHASRESPGTSGFGLYVRLEDYNELRRQLFSLRETQNSGETRSSDALGRRVREVWIAWAKEQPSPKSSWLVPWDDLPEPDKEVDRRIGAALWGDAFASLQDQIATLSCQLAETRREGWVWEPLYPTQDAFDAGLSQLPKGTTSLNLQACWNAMVKVMQRDYRAMLAAAPKEGT